MNLPLTCGKSKTERADYQRRGNVCSSRFRDRVRFVFGGACEYCGEVESPTVRADYTANPSAANAARFFTVDRVIPKSCGGLYVPSNVTFACRSCNSKKRDRNFIGPVRTLAMLEPAS